MFIKRIYFLLILVSFAWMHSNAQSRQQKEAICGNWESTDNQIKIRVFMKDGEFQAILTWFTDTEGKPMDYWTDRHNPDPALRSRKILGLSVLSGLTYHPESNSWEDGMIYDSKHGRDWNASAYIDNKGILKVKGYWHFKFIGHTMAFKRVP